MTRRKYHLWYKWQTWIEENFIKYPYPTFYWPTEYKVVTQAFGNNPEYYGKFGLPGHEGIDMRALDGTEIYACWGGEVVRVANYGAYGKQIRILHEIRGIQYETTYAHLKRMPTHKVTDIVARGELIGFADSTGNSTGSHLHLTLKQFNGIRPDTKLQNKFADEWLAFSIIDPTMFFKELRYGYE